MKRQPLRRRTAGIAELAELRFLLAWRRLRGRAGAAEGVAQFLLFALALPASVLLAGLVGVGSYRAARAGTGLRATVTMTVIIYGIWQTWTAIGLTLSDRDSIDLRRLLVYPLSPARLYLVALVASLVSDPFALFWLGLLSGVLGGAAAARPGSWILLLATALGAFAAATVALIALAQEILARLARSRRWREVAALTAILGWLLLVFSSSGSTGALRSALPALRRLRWVLYPAAMTSEATERLYSGRAAEALPWIAALAAATVVTGWIGYRTAISTARSGGEAGTSAPRDGARRGTLFPERLGPLFEKELRYLARHPAARIYALVLPALAGLVAWKAPWRLGGAAPEILRALPLFGLAAYVHLAFQIFWVNGLGAERGGARTLFLAPIGLHQVLAAKNLALFAFTTGVFTLAAGAYVSVAGAPPLWAGVGALTLEVGLAPVLYALGNVVGILAPRAAPAGVHRAGAVSPLAAVAAMAITSGALAVFALPVLAALWLDALWAVPLAWAALAAAAAFAWRATLPLAGRFLWRRREQVLAAVCGDEV